MCECNVLVAQTLSYPHNWPLTVILLHLYKTRRENARAFSALCALQAVLIGFFSVKVNVGSTGISSHFQIEIECRALSLCVQSTDVTH